MHRSQQLATSLYRVCYGISFERSGGFGKDGHGKDSVDKKTEPPAWAPVIFLI
jgi:hypothetical protein